MGQINVGVHSVIVLSTQNSEILSYSKLKGLFAIAFSIPLTCQYTVTLQ